MISTVAFLASASRMTWAFARENGLPGAQFLAKVHPQSLVPLRAIGLSTIISMVLALINIGSTEAFRALTSLVVSAFYATYVISFAVLLNKRLTTSIEYGPFSMGRAGIPIICLAIIYSVIGIFFSFWPETPELVAEEMNWAIAVFGGVLLLSLSFWVIHGKKVYTGPIVEIE